MKKMFFLSFVAVSACSVFSCKKDPSANVPSEPLILTMAEVNPAESICGLMDTAFKQRVEELSNGSIKIDLRFSGILGDESQVMKIVMSENPSIQLTRVSASLAKYGGKKSKLLSIPFTFSNADHFWKFASSSLAEDFLNEAYEEKLGVKGLFYGEEGFRHFFSTERINGIEDVAGKKMRVSGEVLTELAKSLRAIPVDVPFTDLYGSLKIGTTDIAEQPISNYLSNSFHKTAPYLIMDGHMLGAVQVVVSSKTWDSLSKVQQDMLVEAGKYASAYCKEIVSETENRMIALLKDEGATITEVSDISPWQDACKAMISEASKDYPELYQKILDLSK